MYQFGRGSKVIWCGKPEVPAHRGDGWILMVERKPKDGELYVAQPDGTWLSATPLDVVKSKRQLKWQAECQDRIYLAYPQEIQMSMSLGVYQDEFVAEATDYIAACIQEENRVFDLIEAAGTASEARGITPVWPVVPASAGVEEEEEEVN